MSSITKSFVPCSRKVFALWVNSAAFLYTTADFNKEGMVCLPGCEKSDFDNATTRINITACFI
jgi:hypothetical protein